MEKSIKSSVVCRGPFFLLREHRVTLPDGKEAPRFVLEHPGAVAAVCRLPGEKVILVEQFRKAIERISLEIPAGKLEAGETPEECIKRELIEETGLRAGRLRKLISYYPSCGISDEIIHIYLAEELVKTSRGEIDEVGLKTVILPLGKLKRMIATGKILDSKTIIGVWALEMLE